MELMKRINVWLEKNSTILGAWSSVLSIIAFPTIAISLILGYIQLKDSLISPDLHLEFSSPKALAFKVVNKTNQLAKKPLYGFGLFDIDSDPVSILPIPVKETSYLRGDSKQGPNSLISQYGTDGHRYFGFASVTCENCEGERWYWVYCKKGDINNSWFIELDRNEPKLWNPIELMKEPEVYINKHFPESRRIKIK